MPTQYNPGIPTGTVKLDQDYLNIQKNFTQLDVTYGVDHVKYSVDPSPPGLNGYHKNIHQIPQSDPAAIVGIGQTYVKTVTGATQLFFRSGNGTISRLSPSAGLVADTGYQYIGDILIQWGFNSINNSGTPTTIAFPVAYSVAAYSITIGCFGTSGNSPSGHNAILKTVGTANFVVTNSSSSATVTKIYWMAIGKP